MTDAGRDVPNTARNAREGYLGMTKMKLELVPVSVVDVDRTKAFYIE